MQPCDLHTGQARIRKALEDLQLTCHEARAEWEDAASRAFFEERLEPVVPIVKTALDAASRMQNLLDQAVREVED